MRSRSALGRGVQQLLGRERADPRAAQTLFVLPVAADALFVWSHGNDGVERAYLAAVCVVVAATLLAFALGSGVQRFERWTLLVPVLDIGALGLARLDPESTAAVLLIFPATWLALQFGRLGFGVTVAASAVAFVLPVLLRDESALQTARTLQQLLLAGLCAFAVSITAELWQAKVVEAADAQRMLERAVADSAEQRRFNEAILNSVDVGLLALDASGTVHLVNPRHRKLLEALGAQEAILDQVGRTFGADGFTLLDAQDLPSSRAVLGETLRDYLVWIGEDAGSRRAFAVSVSPFFTAKGVFDGAVLAYHDITELMAASRLKDEFVATVSHELRTPLTSIVGYVDLLLEDVEDVAPDARRFLVTVQRNARRLHRLVDDLLSDTLKLGRAELQLRRMSLDVVVKASAVDAARAARAAGIDFELEVAPEPLEVDGDAERLAQVVDNLFNNAIKFTGPGGSVRGSLRREGADAVVQIADTGRGIPAEELKDVFVKFFRSPGVQLDAIPGTGLGLAISKSIVEAHRGSISISSRVGQGTALEIRLPLLESAVPG